MAASSHPSRARALARWLRRGLGFEVRRYEEALGYDVKPFRQRARLFAREGIDLVVDVGANVGQYATALRRGGYPGDILSLEPLAEPFAELRRRCEADPRWRCRQLALAESAGSAELLVASHSAGSSFLRVGERLVANTPEMAVVGRETVRRETLECLRPEVEGRRALLKLDVQGYELPILRAGRGLLPQLHGVEVELSFQPLYAGEAPFLEVASFLSEQGFSLVTVDPGLPDAGTGLPLQADGLFTR